MVANVDELNWRIGRNLRRARRQDGLTQVELGLRMRIRPNEVSAYENGHRIMTQGMLVRASHALKRDPSWFIVDRDQDTDT